MIESFDNGFQIAVLIVCLVFSVIHAFRYRSRTWTLLSFFYAGWVTGDIYWLLCLIFYDKAPQISVVCDLSWYASYMFLYMLIRYVSPPEELGKSGPVPLLGPVFAVGMAVFFMLYGQIINNLIYAGLMGLLLFSSIRRLVIKNQDSRKVPLSALILIFCLLEYMMWTSSCIWDYDVLIHPYYIFEIMLTLTFPLFIPAAKKAIKQ